MLMVEEPVNAVRGKQVEAAILRVLGAQPPMDFDAAVTAMLEVEKLPVTGVVAEGIRAAHEAYLNTRGEPQVEVFPHPSGDSNKAVLVAVSRDRVAMLNDVIGPVSDEDEMGANLQTTGAQTVGEAAFVILNIGDIGPKGFPAFGAVKSKILGLLSTPTVPDSFRERLRPFEAQMEGTSVRSMYAAYKNLQGSQPPHYVMRSRYVPDRATQSALTILVRDQERFGGLDAQIREIIERNQLQIVTTGGAQMAFNVEYQEKSDHQKVRILRYVVNAPRDDPRVINARDNVQEELVNPPAAPTAAATPPLPALLQPHKAEVAELVRLGKDQRVHFKAVAGLKGGQTLLMIIGPKDEPGVFNIVTHTLDNAKISMDDLGAYDTDHAGLSFAIVGVPLEALSRPSAPGKDSVLKEIEDGIAKRYPTQEEITLRTQLNQILNPEEVELLMSHYRAYRGVPMRSVDPGAAAGEIYISAIAPYSPPLPDLKKLLTEQIEKTVQEKARESGLRPDQIPNVVSIISIQPTEKLQPVVTEEPHPVVTEKLQPAVLVLISMNLSQEAIFRFGLDDAVEEAISHLSGESQAGAEETIVAPPVRTPATSRLAPATVTRTAVPAGTLPSTSGVLGTFSYADTRSQINLLPELRLTTSTAATPAVFGVISGPADTRGLAAGVALSRRASGSDGHAVPVIFIVENQKEEAALTSLGVSVEQIIRVDPSGRYKTVDAAVEQAGGWLSGMYSVTRVVELGVRQPVPVLLLKLLENLFGIRLEDSESIRAWQEVIDQATLVLQV